VAEGAANVYITLHTFLEDRNIKEKKEEEKSH